MLPFDPAEEVMVKVVADGVKGELLHYSVCNYLPVLVHYVCLELSDAKVHYVCQVLVLFSGLDRSIC